VSEKPEPSLQKHIGYNPLDIRRMGL